MTLYQKVHSRSKIRHIWNSKKAMINIVCIEVFRYYKYISLYLGYFWITFGISHGDIIYGTI